MPKQIEVREGKKISPFMILFLIHPVQFGLGVGGGQDLLAQAAGHNGWIGVILAGLITDFLIWVMYALLNQGRGDIITVHKDIFGKWVGGILSLLVIVFFLAKAFTGLIAYISIVHVWVFPELAAWVIALFFLVMTHYAITGGFRVVVGLCFMCFAIPFIGITPVLTAPLAAGHFQNLLPILGGGSLQSLSKATYAAFLPYLGASSLLMAYPFIKNAHSSQKWAHVSNGFTMVLLLFITILAFVYFTAGYLKKIIWPNLSMLNGVEFPFVHRFEIIFIFLYMIVIVPNIVFSLWAASRGFKEVSGLKQRYILIGFLVFLLILTPFYTDEASVTAFTKVFNIGGVLLLYLYVPLLLVIQMAKMKMKPAKRAHSSL